MRRLVAVAAVIALAPSSRPVVRDAAAAPATDAAVTPCVVRVEVSAGRVTLRGGGIDGGDVAALRKVAKKCSAWVAANDDVAFAEVARIVGLVTEQGVDEVRLGAPVGQWMAMDLAGVAKLWKTEPTAKLIAAVKAGGPRLGADNAAIVERLAATLARARQDEPIGKQTTDRGLFEAVAQIVGLHRATAPVASDLLERVVMPALPIDPAASPPVSSDASTPQTGVELFELFVARAGKRTAIKGLLGVIPDADLSTPYADDRGLQLADGDWVVVATAQLAPRLASFDARKLVAQYDRFVERLKLRDEDRVLVETSTRALADLAQCVASAVQNHDALVYRVLPPPIVEVARASDRRTLPTVTITKTGISVEGSKGPVLAALPPASPRTIVIQADRTVAYGRIRAVAAAIGTPGQVTILLRSR